MQILEIKKGAKVKLIWNVSVIDNLVNGSIGKVIDFHRNSKGAIEAIIVAFDSEKSGARQRSLYSTISDQYKEHNGTPIFRKEVGYFTGKSSNNSSKAKLYQFPITLAWAMTAHTMQVY